MFGQDKLTTEAYIDTYKDIAVAEMYRTGIPASITLAQGILESGSGNSRLAVEANNHFGIKCHEWNGDFIREDDDLKDECFRKYADALQSYIDHSEFLMSRSRYAFLFSYDKTDYKKWAHGLKKAGYATNPKYAPLLIGLIERFELHQYDHASMPQIAYKPAGSSNDPVAMKNGNPRPLYTTGIFQNNRINAVILQPNQQLADIAKAYDIRVARLKRYNELDDGFYLEPGMKVYLQPKRNKGEVKEHTVKEGETMFLISQNYGIQLEKLYKRNKMTWGSQPEVGETLRLRGHRDEPPALFKGEPIAQDDSFLKRVTQAINPFYTDADAINKPENPEPQPRPQQQSDTTSPAPGPTVATTDTMAPAQDSAETVSADPYEPFEDVRPKYQLEDRTESMGDKQDVHEKMQDALTDTVQQNPVGKATYLYHTVREGETLYSLSKKYGVGISQLKKWNELKSNDIRIGQTLIVGNDK
jgi:LysM repeat protein